MTRARGGESMEFKTPVKEGHFRVKKTAKNITVLTPYLYEPYMRLT